MFEINFYLKKFSANWNERMYIIMKKFMFLVLFVLISVAFAQLFTSTKEFTSSSFCKTYKCKFIGNEDYSAISTSSNLKSELFELGNLSAIKSISLSYELPSKSVTIATINIIGDEVSQSSKTMLSRFIWFFIRKDVNYPIEKECVSGKQNKPIVYQGRQRIKVSCLTSSESMLDLAEQATGIRPKPFRIIQITQ
jgi:hypothetical protein